MTPPPTPEDMALLDKLWEKGQWAIGAVLFIVAWVWKASKDYSRIDVIQNDVSDLKAKGTAAQLSLDNFKKEANDKFITRPEHAQMQERCQEHIARVQGEVVHAAILSMKEENTDLRTEMREESDILRREMKADNLFVREELSIMNSNICRLLGKFDIHPSSNDRKRATDPFPKD